jgi:hypothetical protein
MDTGSIKELIQNKEGRVRGLIMRRRLDILPPWILYGYIHMIKQPQV